MATKHRFIAVMIGRKKAMRELGSAWKGLLRVCPELYDLHDQIGAWASAHTR